MSGKAGDRIQILGQNVGSPSREGEILEVVEGAVSVRYRVRWHDGHESVLSPSGGSALILPARRRTPKPQRAKTSSKPAKAGAGAQKKKAR
jgi:Domain of unknown function (DUF1918)